jgi:hypothetical protein
VLYVSAEQLNKYGQLRNFVTCGTLRILLMTLGGNSTHLNVNFVMNIFMDMSYYMVETYITNYLAP